MQFQPRPYFLNDIFTKDGVSTRHGTFRTALQADGYKAGEHYAY